MATPFATYEELTARLDWDLDTAEQRVARNALEDASDQARAYGRSSWVDAETAPRLVRTTVLGACVRYMKNPEGYTQSRAGDETLGWNEQGEDAGTVHFTEREIKLLETLAGKRVAGFMSVPTFAWGARRRPRDIFLPVGRSTAVPEKSFPYYAAEDASFRAPLDGGVLEFPLKDGEVLP